MSNTIDQKVVEMRFDNKNFESNVSTSMSTLDKLKKALKFDGASKGLENINSAVKKCDMSSMSNGVQNVHAKFSALEVMAVTALANITNRAMAAGEQLIKSFTLDPIKTGFQEYETQINAVQTILANTSHAGTDLQQVNAALDELNTYADKTIYNFTEMTRNIGTFTAAGVDLDTSVSAIKGIANLAAVSGSTSQQASTAMYQLSQALAAGTVKLQDWNSVVNAGMGGKVFQDALIRTSELLKTGAKEAIAAEGSFRESLTKSGWLTTEVLTETLKQFAGAYSEADLISQGYTKSQAKAIADMSVTAIDAATKVKTFTQLMDTLKEATQSGWTQSWEIMIGDFEEAKALFTELSDFFGDIINKTSETRNAMLEGAFSSPWEQLTKRIEATGLSVDDFKMALKQTATTHHASLDRMIKEEGSLAAAIQSGRVKKEWVIETLKNLAGANKGAAKSTEDMTKKLEQFQKVVDAVWRGDFGNGVERMKALTKAGHDYATIQDLVNKTVDGHKLTLKDLSDEQLKSANLTEEQIKQLRALAEEAEKTGTPLNELIENMYKPSGRELMIDSLRNSLKAIVKVCSSLKAAWDDAFPPMTSGQLYKIIEAVHGVSEAMVMTDDTADKLTRTLKGVFAIVDIITTIVGGTLKFGFEALCAILRGFDLDILDVTAGIGDLIVGFRNWIDENNIVLKGLESFASGIKKSIPVVQNWYKEFMALPQVQQAISDFHAKCDELFSSITESAGNAWGKIKEFFNTLKNIDWRSLSVEDVKRMFEDLGKTILSAIEEFTGPFDQIEAKLKDFKNNTGKYLKDLAKSAEEHLSNVGGFFGDVYKKIKDVVTYITEKIDIDWGAVFAIATGVMVLKFLGSLSKALDFVSNFSVAGLIGLEDVLESYQKKLKAQALKEQAIAIGILAASVAVLAMLPIQDVAAAAGVLVVLGAALVGFAFAMSKIGDVGKVSVSMTAVAGALILLAGAMYIIQDLDADALVKTIAALGIVAVGLVAVAKTLSSKEAMKLPSGAMFMIAFAGSLFILISALKKLDNTDVSASSIFELLVIIAALKQVVKSAKNVKVSSALTLVASVVAIEALLRTIKKLADFDTATLIEGILKLIPVILTYKMLLSTTKSVGEHADKAGFAILAMSASVMLMAKTIEMMSDLSVSDILKATVAIAALEYMFTLLIKSTAKAGPNATKAGGMLLMMSGAMIILSGAIAILTKIGKEDQGAMWSAVAAIVILEAAFVGIIAVSKLAGQCKATLIVITAAVTLLAVAIGALAMIEKDNLMAASTALTMVIGVFTLLIAATSLVQTGFKNITSVIVTLGSLIVVVGILAEILVYLNKVDPVKALQNAEALSLLILSLSTSMAILDSIRNVSSSAIGALYGVGAAVALLAVLMGTLNKMDMNTSIESATALSILLLAMTGVTAALSAIGPTGTLAIKGALALDAVIAVIGGLMVGIGALVDKYPQLETFVDKCIPVLSKVGYGIGSFIGSIVGGLSEGVFSGLPGIGEHLSNFMTNAEGFIKGSSNIDQNMGTSVKALVDAILALTGARILDGISNFLPFKTSFEDFSKQIVAFGEAMVSYSKIVSGNIDAEAVTASANAGKTLAELANNLPTSDASLMHWFNGKISLTEFSSQIQSFAHAIVGYNKIIMSGGGINEKAVTASVNAGKTLAELSNNLPSAEGTWAYWFTGKIDLVTFGNQIRSFAYAISDYNKIIMSNGGINEKAITASASAGKTLAELSNNLPSAEGTWAYWFTGKIDLTTFGLQIRSFAYAISEYSKILMSNGGINEEAILASATAGKTLAELANSLPAATGTLEHFFSGKMDMATFGANLKDFGLSFLSYANHMKSVDANVVTSTANAATSLVTLANGLPEDKFFTNETHLDEFGKQLATFGKKFAEYYDHISGINPATLSGVVTEIWRLLNLFTQMSNSNFDGVSGFKTALKDLGKAGVDEFVNNFKDAGTKVNQAVTTLMSTAIAAANAQKANLSNAFANIMDGGLGSIKGKLPQFQTLGTQSISVFITGIRVQGVAINIAYTTIISNALTMIKNKFVDFESAGEMSMIKFIGGVRSKDSGVKSAFTNGLSSAVSAINGYYSNFYNAGRNLALGFAYGIEDYAYVAEMEAEQMARAAVRAAEFELDINSPSRVMYRVGAFAGEGFVNALSDYSDKAGSAGAEMATNTLKAVGNTIAKLSALIEDGIDVTPTITPVLDLSEVEAETSRLNAMFSTNRAMNISSSMNKRAASLNNQNEVQNGTAPVSSGNSYQFVQNNYSPKALSRVELYRQTNNQFSAFQRTVKA